MKASTIMSSKIVRVTSWVMAAVLLLAAGWSLNVAMYCWWAAGFHNQYSHAYVSRAAVFFIIALVLFGAFVSVVVLILRWSKRRRLAKT